MTDTMQTYDNDLAYMFDGAIAERVVALLNEFDIPAEADWYEPGMCQVRIDPADRTQPHGWIAVAGQGENMQLGWFLIETTFEATPHIATAPGGGFYYTNDDFIPTSLNRLPITAEPAQVATALMQFLAKQG